MSVNTSEYYSTNKSLKNDINNILLFKKYIDDMLLSVKQNNYDIEDIKQLSNYYKICINKASNSTSSSSSSDNDDDKNMCDLLDSSSSSDESTTIIKRKRTITDDNTLFDNYIKLIKDDNKEFEFTDPFIKDILDNNININNYYYLNKFNCDRINFYSVNLNLL
jgi:hypothetical protein